MINKVMIKKVLFCIAVFFVLAFKFMHYWKDFTLKPDPDKALMQAMQQNQAQSLSEQVGEARLTAEGLSEIEAPPSVEYQEGYEWAMEQRIINPEWCFNQERDGDFIIGCQDFAYDSQQ